MTPQRLAEIGRSLSPSDQALLDIVDRFGLATGPQLTRVLWSDGDSAGRAGRRALKRLSDLGVLSRLERRIGGVRAGSDGLIFRVGPAGQRLLGDRRRLPDEPGLHHLLHTLAITDLYARLAQAQRGGQLAVLAFEAEPVCWRPYSGPHGDAQLLKPDAFVDVRIGDRRRLWFVEIDRGTVSTGSLRAKLRRYADYLATGAEQSRGPGVFPRVVWSTNSERRSDHLRQLVATENRRLGAELHRLLPDEWAEPPSAEPRMTDQ